MSFSTKMLNVVGVFLLASAVVSAGGTPKHANPSGQGRTHQSSARAYGLHKLTTLRPRNHAVLPRRVGSMLSPRQDSGCEHHGTGYTSCGLDSCYNPSIHVCCNDGMHCDVGQVCIDGTEWCCPEENPDCATEETDDITDDIDDIIGGGSGCESYGPSYQSCGADGCYDPSIHVCCNDGLHCDVGEVCIDNTEFCCPESNPNCADEEDTGDNIDIDLPGGDDDDDTTGGGDDDDTSDFPELDDLPGGDDVDDIVDDIFDDAAGRLSTGLVLPMVIGAAGLMALL